MTDKLEGYYIFETAIGLCALAWDDQAICRVFLPEADRSSLTERLLRETGLDRSAESMPGFIKKAAGRIAKHLAGRLDPLTDLKVTLPGRTEFSDHLYRTLRTVKPGQIITYGELAKLAGKPKAARAVGGAMAVNPLPLIVPCHRVVAFDHSLVGFSAHGGLELKRRLLIIEGAKLD